MSSLICRGNILGIFAVGVALTPGSVAANTTAEQTFTLQGAKVGDIVDVNKPSLDAGIGIANVRVSAANQVAVKFSNSTGGAITPKAEKYTFIIYRPETAGNLPSGVPAL
ncbi:hypothetical protein [Telmatospirillum sp.]|uniref:hypothetical protein n=1 Tax=Telmatospirillum sp. TaxID=2079197 RepID=UPI00284E0CC6|nr:hypothetical protein [Telmatospirillum sp.]MDR3439875.1 hypothetical protein [Telmatospirillum sp.]